MYMYYTLVHGVYIGPAGRLIIRKGDNDNSHTHTHARAPTPLLYHLLSRCCCRGAARYNAGPEKERERESYRARGCDGQGEIYSEGKRDRETIARGRESII